MRKRRLEIVVETERRFTLRKTGREVAFPCDRCAGRMVTTEEAVTISGLSSRAIHRQAEAGAIHFAETDEGLLFICLASIRREAPGIKESET